MNLKNSHDTPSGYLDAMENALLDTTVALRALRLTPPVPAPMFAGPFDAWRDDEAAPPTFDLPADEPVLARGFETMLQAMAHAPRTADVAASLGACLGLLRHSWITHRRLDTTGHVLDDGCRACRTATEAADGAYNRLFEWASCYPYQSEDVAA
ncbi:hypothetical protein [Rhodococcus sp. IEGM 1330]|uniref:hypothetical protein n=1 Tax=Rhodococcus sp. IEGM 1330 TaxID=3082225 RepID=UPI0029550015|nr:hypothetical protein [Rhodococcus sp. IEGM 1330]MDV8021020.1 hypothetical protein [Rhodococcus sp. IEGM 1330]